MALLSLFATLVTVKSDPKNRHHSVVPHFLVRSARESRLRGGDRLLARALRHSLDHERTEIYDAHAAVIEYKNYCWIRFRRLRRRKPV